MKVAGIPGKVRPMPGLRLKINLLLLAIQVPALAILAFSTTRGIRELVEDMARSHAGELASEVNKRIEDELDDFETVQRALRAFMDSTTGARAAAVFRAEDNQLQRRAHWGEDAPWDPDEYDHRAFAEGGVIHRNVELPNSMVAVVHRALRDPEGQVVGVIRLELDQSENALQVQSYNRQLLVGMVVIFALTVLVLFLGMHLLVVSPVKSLVGAMGHAREGWLEPVAAGPAHDEIGWLARSYNDMVYRLRGVLEEKEVLLGEVRDLNLNLQSRIEEATSDLARSHQELERAYHDLYASQREHERLERLASLGQVAREIAHEFATPLNVISGTLQMLLEDSGLRREHRDRLGRLLAQTERLIQICRDTLSPLKMPAPVLGPADLNGLVEEVGAFMAPAFAARGVELRPRLAPDLPPVHADPGQIEQVLLNLISNALDALPGGGRIEIETRLDATSQPPAVVLLVRDDGVGIAPEHLSRIFDPFFTTKGIGRGTGLGLAICKEIVGQHHGEIRIESAPGRGSEVMVRLPAAAVAPSGAAA